MHRRQLLANAAAFGLVTAAAPAIAFAPARASTRTMAEAFTASSEAEALDILFPGLAGQAEDTVRLTLPWMAARGMPVVARVECDRKVTQAIAITAANAARPLVTLAILMGTTGSFSARIMVPETTPVTAWVLTEAGLLTASRTIKVTRGGYGTTFP